MEFGSDDDPVDDSTTIGSNLTGKNDEEDSVYLCNIDDEEGSNLSILPVRKKQKDRQFIYSRSKDTAIIDPSRTKMLLSY